MCSIISTNSDCVEESEEGDSYGKQLCVHLIGTELQRNSNLRV